LVRWLGVTRAIPWLIKVAITFAITNIGWLLFRERNLAQIMYDLGRSPFAAGFEQWQIGLYLALLVLLYASPLIIHLIATVFVLPSLQARITLPEIVNFTLQSATAALIFFGIIVARSVVTSDFIYFQF